MEITHPRILGFFQEHKNLAPEETILKFIDIMESLHENMNKTMNNSVITECGSVPSKIWDDSTP